MRKPKITKSALLRAWPESKVNSPKIDIAFHDLRTRRCPFTVVRVNVVFAWAPSQSRPVCTNGKTAFGDLAGQSVPVCELGCQSDTSRATVSRHDLVISRRDAGR